MNSYTPVQYYYIESIQEAILRRACGKVFFFNDQNEVDSAEGMLTELKEIPHKGFFIRLESGPAIRIDRIITLFGKPSAAYDEYDSYANQCLACTGGYDPDTLP